MTNRKENEPTDTQLMQREEELSNEDESRNEGRVAVETTTMKEEHIIGWLEHQKLIMDKEILNLANWVEQSKEDVTKAKTALAAFEYRLERATSLRQYMDELEKKVGS